MITALLHSEMTCEWRHIIVIIIFILHKIRIENIETIYSAKAIILCHID